ncbi:MAG: translation initiation factor [Candidatus Tumulicola sp.]
MPELLPQKTQIRRFIAQAVGQLAAARLPKRTRMPGDRRSPQRPQPFPNDGVVRILRARRRASTVSIVAGLEAPELQDVAKLLKRHCGSGGTAKDGTVVIQGDHREKIAAWLAARGRKVKLAGG